MSAPIAGTVRRQWRVVFSGTSGGAGACFIDAADEAGALRFFAQAFPGCSVLTVTLEPVDPCAAYEPRAGR